MVTEKILLQNPERFKEPHEISRTKLEKAAWQACERLAYMAKAHYGLFPSNWSTNFLYTWDKNKNWVSGMYTGCYWLAYQLTGDKFFREVAESHLDSYKVRLDERRGILGHDVGFPYMPSCAAAYMVTGNEYARKIALDTAEFFYGNGYEQRAEYKYIKTTKHVSMMDTMMNAFLFLWAGKETGDEKFKIAGLNQFITTNKFLIRSDASSFHHYQFDPETALPVRGKTLQGHSDDSCWSRGHSWGVYAMAGAYEYTGEPFIKQLQKDITYFALNHLPSDLIPYWDFDFVDGDEARDTSAGLIIACGMHEMAKHLDSSDEQKPIYESASAKMLESIIDSCTSDFPTADGLVKRVTASKPHGYGVDEVGVYGDFFYLEALARYLLGDEFIRYW